MRREILVSYSSQWCRSCFCTHAALTIATPRRFFVWHGQGPQPRPCLPHQCSAHQRHPHCVAWHDGDPLPYCNAAGGAHQQLHFCLARFSRACTPTELLDRRTLVRRTLEGNGFEMLQEAPQRCSILWGTYFPQDMAFLASLPPSIRLNCAPRIVEITHKHRLARLRAPAGAAGAGTASPGPSRIAMPATYVFPEDAQRFRAETARDGPEGLWMQKALRKGCGRGTEVRTREALLRQWGDEAAGEPPVAGHGPTKKGRARGQAAVVQRYVERPLLVNGRKCDLRIFVATTFAPLRVYLYRNAIVRFAKNPYSLCPSTFQDRHVHVTNCHHLHTDDWWCLEQLREWGGAQGVDFRRDVWDAQVMRRLSTAKGSGHCVMCETKGRSPTPPPPHFPNVHGVF